MLTTPAPGQVIEVITLELGEIIVRLVDREEPDWGQFVTDRESEHQRVLNRRLGLIWNDWLADLKKQARIIDNRYLFF